MYRRMLNALVLALLGLQQLRGWVQRIAEGVSAKMNEYQIPADKWIQPKVRPPE
jgi:hypothetical protein